MAPVYRQPPYPRQRRRSVFAPDLDVATPASTGITGKVDAALNSDPLDPTPSYIDFTGRVFAIRTKIGRDGSNLQGIPPGNGSTTLDNSDRALDSAQTSGPYVGKLKPGKRIRVRANTTATGTVGLMHFYADDWPPDYSEPDDGTLELTGVDASIMLTGRSPASVFDIEILADNPTAYYGLGEDADATTGADKSGNAHDGTYLGPRSPATGLVFGGGDGASSFGAGSALDLPAAAALTDFEDLGHDGGIGVVAIFQTSNTDALYRWIYWQQDDTNHFAVSMYMQPDGTVAFLWTIDGAGITRVTPTALNDGNRHVVVGRVIWDDGLSSTTTSLWTDGVSSSLSAVGLGAASAKGVRIGAPLSTFDGAATSFLGSLDEVGLLQPNPSDARIAAYTAGAFTPWDGDTTGTRIGRYLDLALWPAGDRNLDTGVSILGPAILNGRTYKQLLDRLATTEQGALFADQDGKINFRDRHAVFTDARSTASQFTFTDDAAAGPSAYRYSNIKIESASVRQVVNVVTVNWARGSITLADDASVGQHGERPRTYDTEIATANEARNFIEWVLLHYAQPRDRIRYLVLDLTGDPNLIVPGLTARIGDRVTIRRRPLDTGTATTYTALIEGVEHEADDGNKKWFTILHVDTVELLASIVPWFIGVNHLGVDSALGY